MRKSAVITALIALIACLCMAATGCRGHKAERDGQDLIRIQSSNGKESKKVILLLIDSLMPQQIDQGIKQNKLPAFKDLIEHGHYDKDMVSSFPTMSVSVDSALMTGAYPNEHRIPGLTWYSWQDKKVINYGTGPMEVARHGVNRTLVDAIVNLNGRHLNPKLPTIYEELARLGMSSGSINGLIYRGSTEHRLSLPAWLRVATSLPQQVAVKGPDLLALGTLANPFEGVGALPEGVTDRFGLNNVYSMQALNYLIDSEKLPDFLLVYLPDLDQKIHKKGLSNLNGIKEVDKQLLPLVDKLNSGEKGMDKAVLIIIGDNGLAQLLPAKSNSVVNLRDLLKEYRILRPGEEVGDDTDIVLAVNDMMAYVYYLSSAEKLDDIAQRMVSDSRIDIVAWQEGDWIRVRKGASGQELRYKSGGSVVDAYKQRWTIQGQPEVLDLKMERESQSQSQSQSLSFGQYPDALMRLYGAIHSHEGSFLIVTAKQGYELADSSSPTHEGGGGHGSLHQQESLVPLILYGTDRKPEYRRIIDLKPYILDLLKKTRE